MGNNSKVGAMVFFLPEIVLIAFALLASAQLSVLMFEGGQLLFSQCQTCIQSKAFSSSFFLFIFCLTSHCIRFLLLHLSGNRLLVKHSPSLAETSISVLIFIGYAVFLRGVLASPSPVDSDIAVSIVDVIGASFSALSLIIIVASIGSVFSNFSNEG